MISEKFAPNDFAMDFFSLEGKVAIVTGGCTGLGQAIATALAKAGADILTTSHHSGGEETRRLVEQAGRRLEVFHVDLAEPDAADKIIGRCLEVYGKVDILVNNAGTTRRRPILEYRDEDWRAVMEVNIDAVYYLCQRAAVQMAGQGGGKIINIASMASFQGGKMTPPYTASKHAVAGITKAFAVELSTRNIQVNAIAPGYMYTDMTAPLAHDEGRNTEIMSRIPAERWGAPSDLMGAAVFLASRASDYVCGHILAVDGGYLTK